MENLNNMTLKEQVEYYKNKNNSANQSLDQNSESETNKNYQKRFLWMLASTLIFAGVHFAMYYLNSIFYGMSLGFLLANIILLFIFVLDYLFIPGDTFNEKTNHATILAIIAFSVYVGIFIGEGYSANSIRNEQYDRTEQNADAPKQDVGVSEPNGTPNR